MGFTAGVKKGHWGPQQGRQSDEKKDRMYKAMVPGLRVSKFGHEYYEYRKNRTDKNPNKRL